CRLPPLSPFCGSPPCLALSERAVRVEAASGSSSKSAKEGGLYNCLRTRSWHSANCTAFCSRCGSALGTDSPASAASEVRRFALLPRPRIPTRLGRKDWFHGGAEAGAGDPRHRAVWKRGRPGCL